MLLPIARCQEKKDSFNDKVPAFVYPKIKKKYLKLSGTYLTKNFAIFKPKFSFFSC